MSLANLTINVIADTGAAQSGLRSVGETARTSMLASGVAVDDFRASLARASDNLQTAARQIGSAMDAANDHIVTGSEQSAKAVEGIGAAANDLKFDGLSAKITNAIATGVGAGYAATQTWLQKTEEFVKSKVEGIAIGLGLAAVSATAAAVYASYKIISGTYGFLAGLITGDSYKSANIDALIEANKQAKELQETLRISSQDAAALGDALARLGVDKADYTTPFKNAEEAMRTNGDELDRLGVKYKDNNGKLLEQRQFLANVKAALDEYTAGWDRNKAAAAIGAGSYEQITAALSVTTAEIDKSKDRLDDYLLSIGPKTQQAVDDYQQAMRDFDNETRLTSEGFKRAIADNIMPALTELAKLFTDGWPVVVRAFRYVIADITSLFWGLETVAYTVTEAVLGSIEALAIGTAGVAAAIVKVFTGDFSAAKDQLVKGWEDAKTRFAQIGDNIVGNATKARDAMALAFGMDASTKTQDNPFGNIDFGGGKSYTPKPDKPAAVPKDTRDSYAAFLQQLDRMILKTSQSEFAALQLEAAQKAQKEGITDLSGAYDRINKVQRADSQKAVDTYVASLKRETDMYAAQTQLLGLTSVQQEVATMALQKRQAVEDQILQAKRSSKPLDEQAIADLRSQTEATIALSTAQITSRDQLMRSAEYGSAKALQDYQRNATDAAKNVADVINGSFSRMEDALVQFVHTGKLNLGSLFAFMADEYLRQMARMAIANASSGGIASLLGNVFGSYMASNTGTATTVANAMPGDALDNLINVTGGFASVPLATGTNFVPYDGMPATLHKGEAVVPAAYNPAAGGRMPGGEPQTVINQHVYGGVTPNDLSLAMGAMRKQILGEVAAGRRNNTGVYA